MISPQLLSRSAPTQISDGHIASVIVSVLLEMHSCPLTTTCVLCGSNRRQSASAHRVVLLASSQLAHRFIIMTCAWVFPNLFILSPFIPSQARTVLCITPTLEASRYDLFCPPPLRLLCSPSPTVSRLPYLVVSAARSTAVTHAST